MTNFNAIKEISTKLNEMFAPMDAEVLAKSIVWAKSRVEAIKEFKKAANIRELGSHKYYQHLFAIAGGKTWYNVFNGRNEEMINEFVTKNCAATAEKRNASIARKLEKAEVTAVKDYSYARTSDGFNGFFVVETNKGEKRVKIETIGAGGYNIQCYHLRVLVSVK